jgi:hypothetical protein
MFADRRKSAPHFDLPDTHHRETRKEVTQRVLPMEM